VCLQLTLCDPHLSALEVRFSRRCAIQIDVYLTYLTYGQCFNTYLSVYQSVSIKINRIEYLLHIDICSYY